MNNEVAQKPQNGAVREEEYANDGMMAEERRMQILQIVRSDRRAKVNDLVRRFNTSAVTIRSDLNELDQRGLLQRSHDTSVQPAENFFPLLLYCTLILVAESPRKS